MRAMRIVYGKWNDYEFTLQHLTDSPTTKQNEHNCQLGSFTVIPRGVDSSLGSQLPDYARRQLPRHGNGIDSLDKTIWECHQINYGGNNTKKTIGFRLCMIIYLWYPNNIEKGQEKVSMYIKQERWAPSHQQWKRLRKSGGRIVERWL